MTSKDKTSCNFNNYVQYLSTLSKSLAVENENLNDKLAINTQMLALPLKYEMEIRNLIAEVEKFVVDFFIEHRDDMLQDDMLFMKDIDDEILFSKLLFKTKANERLHNIVAHKYYVLVLDCLVNNRNSIKTEFLKRLKDAYPKENEVNMYNKLCSKIDKIDQIEEENELFLTEESFSVSKREALIIKYNTLSNRRCFLNFSLDYEQKCKPKSGNDMKNSSINDIMSGVKDALKGTQYSNNSMITKAINSMSDFSSKLNIDDIENDPNFLKNTTKSMIGSALTVLPK